MKNEIVKKQKIILMKSGLPIWCDEERVKTLEDILAGGTGHRFIKIDDKTINSAEIEGIYSSAQFDDITKLKQGQWCCIYKVWHPKKGECYCAREFMRKVEDDRRRREMDERNRPSTPEEMESINAAILVARKDLEAKGVLPPKT